MTLRVLMVVPGMHPRDGGPPRVVYGSAMALAAVGVAVEIATTGSADDDDDTRRAWSGLSTAGIALHIFPRVGPTAIGISPELTAFAQRRAADFDVLHIHCIWENSLAGAAAAFRRVHRPYCISAHGMLDRWQMQRSSGKKWIARTFFGTGSMLRNADAILYGSADEAGEGAHLGLRGKIAIVPNGVDRPTGMIDKVAREQVFARYPALRRADRTVLFFSRLHPKKGLDLLVEAFGQVKDAYPRAVLFVAAIPQDAAYETEIAARIAAQAPTNIVLTTDLVGPQAKAALSACDIFCLPSHQEGFSMAIIEAAGVGIPLLITDKCHLPEVAATGAGMVVPDTVEGLTNGLRQMLALDETEVARMGRRAAQLVIENYTWDRVAVKLGDLYQSLAVDRSRE